MIVTAGNVDVFDPPPGSRQRGSLSAGNWAGFAVGKKPPINLGCATYVFTELLHIITDPQGTPIEWVVAAHCTSCG